jgi:hypothetical protein
MNSERWIGFFVWRLAGLGVHPRAGPLPPQLERASVVTRGPPARHGRQQASQTGLRLEGHVAK